MIDDNKNQGMLDDNLLEDSDSQDSSAQNVSTRKSGQQGFASMPKDKQREIASKGGKAAHEQGTAHEWTSEEAREAGRRGGQSRGASSQNMEELEQAA